MEELMLTTTDNPFDPFTRYEDWRMFDISHDYGTEELIGRLAYSDSDASPASQQNEYNETLRRIVKNDPLHIYKIVSRPIVPESVQN